MKINIKQIFSKNEDKHKIYHLSEFLIEKIFLTYLVIFVLITSLQLIIEYHSEKNNVKKTLNTFIDSNLQEIDKAIFSNDKLLLNHILEQISNKNEVTQIILIDTNNKKQFSWKFENLKSSSGDIVIRKTLVYNQIPLGTLIISSSNSIIIGKLIDIYVKILFTNLIIFISLVIMVYIFSKKFLVKPLVNFSDELKKLSSQDVMPMVSLDDMEVDEIHSLKNTANIFIQEIFVLKESYKLLIDDLMEKYEETVKQNQTLEEEVKDKDKEIIQKEYKFQSIFEQSNVPIAITDLSGNIIECNKSYCKFLEYDNEEELKGVNFSTLTHPDDIEAQKKALAELFTGTALNKRMEKRYLSKNSAILWADLTFTEIFNENNEIINFVAILVDITKKKKYETELEKLYNLALDANALTGLPGNNTIRKHIEDILDNYENYCVLYADLDHFKAYNDNYGFAMGDNIIKHSANIFEYIAKELTLDSFFLGHIGGDDFVILIPSDRINEYTSLVISDFEKSIKSFYSQEDYELGYIQSHDRNGNLQNFPFISLSIAGIDLSTHKYTSYLEINDALSIAKKHAKKIEGNSFYIEKIPNA